MHQIVSINYTPPPINGGFSTLCRIKAGWEDCGKFGQYCGQIYVNGKWWAIVLWDGDEDPDLHKAEGIEVEKLESKWVNVKNS